MTEEPQTQPGSHQPPPGEPPATACAMGDDRDAYLRSVIAAVDRVIQQRQEQP